MGDTYYCLIIGPSGADCTELTPDEFSRLWEIVRQSPWNNLPPAPPQPPAPPPISPPVPPTPAPVLYRVRCALGTGQPLLDEPGGSKIITFPYGAIAQAVEAITIGNTDWVKINYLSFTGWAMVKTNGLTRCTILR